MNKSRPVINIDTEQLLWQGRPAPRCYTLRHWRRALPWALVLFVAAIWQLWMWHTRGADGAWGMVFVPVPVLLLSFALSGGRFIRARFEWGHVYYLLSDTSLRIQRGRKGRVTRYPYTALQDVSLELYHNDATSGLGWVHAKFGGQKVTLECLEDAQEAYTIIAGKLQEQRGKRG